MLKHLEVVLLLIPHQTVDYCDLYINNVCFGCLIFC